MTAFELDVAIWRKSRHSLGNGNCVQVAASSGTMLVRDSADSTSPVVSYSAEAWRAFVAATKMAKLRAPQ